MTRRTTRIAALSAGALITLGFFSATPAGASDGAQADAKVSADATTVINETLGIVNQACMDVSQVGDSAVQALASEKGISVAASPAGNTLGLNVSLPALTGTLNDTLGSLPLLGSLTGQIDAAAPVKVSCATAENGTGLGLSAAGVDALVNAVLPGVNVDQLLADIGLELPAVDVRGTAATGTADPGTTQISAQAAGSLPAPKPSTSAAVRTRTAAAAPTTSTSVQATPASASDSDGIVAQTVGSPGALARTGAGVGALGLLGAALVGSGRLVSFSRKLLRIG
jgi:hypothetical protein